MFSRSLAGVGVKVSSATAQSWGPTINSTILRSTTGRFAAPSTPSSPATAGGRAGSEQYILCHGDKFFHGRGKADIFVFGIKSTHGANRRR